MEGFVEFGIKAQKKFPNFITEKFTKGPCNLFGRTRSKIIKKQFAKTYKINWKQAQKCKSSKTLDTCLNNFPNLNDLFARKIDSSLTEPEKTGANDIVSPAECHARKVSATKYFNIKGARYTLSTLVDSFSSSLKSNIFIFRLAPDQYHRFHSPTTSIIESIKEKGGTYKSVNPILLNDQPVLQENFRKIIEFKNGLIMVIVGATCVGSIDLTVKKGDKVKHGEDMGAFHFGGSCIALVVPHKIISYNKTLSTNEKVIQPGSWVATFVPTS